MRRLGQSQTVCLINFDHVGLIFAAVLAPQLFFLPSADCESSVLTILNSETGYFSSETYSPGEHR
jgi:hypothetical protein